MDRKKRLLPPRRSPPAISHFLISTSGDAGRAFSRNAHLITYRPERACKPGSVTRRWRVRGHLSGTMVAHRLKRPTRGLGRAALEHPLIWPCSGWGLPSQPGHPGCWCALTAPFHPYPDSAGRFVFCGTFPRVTPGGRYPPPCPVEPGLSSRRLLLRAAAQPTPVDISYSSAIACTTGVRQAAWRTHAHPQSIPLSMARLAAASAAVFSPRRT